jgi:glycosyltransferase involved in cell wall biosynthesis
MLYRSIMFDNSLTNVYAFVGALHYCARRFGTMDTVSRPTLISLIHPSRGRPQQSFATIKKWLLRAGTPFIEIILSLDMDDPTLPEYIQLYYNAPFRVIFSKDYNKGAVEAVNRAARIARGNIFIVVSDDTDCSTQWAVRLLKYTEGQKDFVLKTPDGIQPVMITMPILDRAYYMRDGYIYHPDFKHAWADRYFTEIAHKRKRVIKKNIMFKHLHYSKLKKKPDERYRVTDATFNEGRQIYKRLMKNAISN